MKLLYPAGIRGGYSRLDWLQDGQGTPGTASAFVIGPPRTISMLFADPSRALADGASVLHSGVLGEPSYPQVRLAGFRSLLALWTALRQCPQIGTVSSKYQFRTWKWIRGNSPLP
jgi:hypothetical protein